MNKTVLATLGVLCFGIATIMLIVGLNNSALTELADTFWIPIPLGVVFLVLSFKKKSE